VPKDGEEGALEVAAAEPEHPDSDGEDGAAALVDGGGEVAAPPLLGALGVCAGADGCDAEGDADEPEEPAGEGELLGDEIGKGDHPRKEPEIPGAEAGERADGVPGDDRDAGEGDVRYCGIDGGEAVDGGDAERYEKADPEDAGGREAAAVLGVGGLDDLKRDLGEREG